LALGFEEDVPSDRADEIRTRSQPRLVIELIEQGERLLDPECVELIKKLNAYAFIER
jgi:hypothetical protein